ncbi:MAG: type II secretion system protein GspN [Desulfatibacillaceae bacterium]
MKRILGYALYTIAVFILFLYVLFPSEQVVDYAEARFERMVPTADLTLEEIRPVAPFSVRAVGPRVRWRDMEVFAGDDVVVDPAVLATLRKKPAAAVTARAYGGTLKADISMSAPGLRDPLSAHLEIRDVDVSAMSALQKAAGRKVMGAVSGKVDFTGIVNQWHRGEGGGRLEVGGGGIELVEGLVDLEYLTFDSLIAEFDMKNGVVNLSRCEMSGRQVNGELSGDIRLSPSLPQSSLNLTGTINPTNEFFMEIGTDSPVAQLLREKAQRGRVPVRISGTLARPLMNFR